MKKDKQETSLGSPVKYQEALRSRRERRERRKGRLGLSSATVDLGATKLPSGKFLLSPRH